MEEPEIMVEDELTNSASDERVAFLKQADSNCRSKTFIESSTGSTVTYVAFLLFGLSSVFPWNVFITAKPYFDSRLYKANDTFNVTAEYRNTLEVFFGIGSQVSSLIIQLIMTSIIHRISLHIRMYIPLAGMLVIFAITAAVAWVSVTNWMSWFFYLTIVSVILTSVCASVFQISTFGLAGIFPKQYMHATMIGQGVGGVAVSIFEILILLIIEDYSISGFIYFFSAVLVILMTIVSYGSMTHQPYAIPFLNDAKLEDSTNIQLERKKPIPPFFKIFCKLYVPALSVFLVFMVTLGCFPSVVSMIESKSENDRWRETFFTPVVCFLFFNFWDFVGRTTSFLQIPTEKNMHILAILAVLRLAFYPLFAYCNIPHRENTNVFFKEDFYPMIFVTLLGFSNGYLGSLCVMYGPKLVEPEHQETAGAMMAFFLVFGLAMGSLSALIVINVI